MPNYTYNNNIPLSTDILSTSQGQLKTNCESVFSILDQDLFGFGDNNGGLHQKSTYVVQGSDPVPVNTDGSQGIVYSKTVNSIAEIFVTRYGSTTPVQLTKGPISGTGNSTSPGSGPTWQTGYSFLPGGVLIQWGSVTASTGGAPFNFPVPFTNIFSIVGNIQAGGPQAFTIKSVGTTSAVAQSSSGSQTLNWIAIGN